MGLVGRLGTSGGVLDHTKSARKTAPILSMTLISVVVPYPSPSPAAIVLD
jgi:hypothetical protein